jgi:hypothetical protein
VRRREESDPRYITNAAEVKLRSFTTKVGSSHAVIIVLAWLGCACRPDLILGWADVQVHKVDTMVAYKLDE